MFGQLHHFSRKRANQVHMMTVTIHQTPFRVSRLLMFILPPQLMLRVSLMLVSLRMRALLRLLL